MLAVVLVLVGSIFAGTRWSDATWAPKLALDLEGGTQIILQAVTTNNEPVSSADINQAIEIIRQRVDSSGVAEAEITSQGGQNIVVALPGQPDKETLALVRESAQMQFRPVLVVGDPAPVKASEDTTGQTDGDSTDAGATDTAGTGTEDAATSTEGATSTAEPSDTESATTDPADTSATEPTTAPTTEPTTAPDPDNPSDLNQITEALWNEYDALDCTDPANLTGGGHSDPTKPMVACEADEQVGTAKYILGPMEIPGSEIKSAASGLKQTQQGVTLNEWIVNIEFNSEGAKQFAEVTKRLSQLPTYAEVITGTAVSAPNMFAMVLDNLVISAPGVTYSITDGRAEISGNFTNESANKLASQLSFGALPLTFEVQSEESISATLGSEQLQMGLLAGAIGLGLVVIYSLIQYRMLGLVTVASLTVATTLTILAILLLSWLQGYRLSLPGVAGVIIAIGITADSFIVYFERIRDELRDGRSLESAVEVGWDRARRTILASDAVNFIAAIVLYFLAVGGVRGFAFTLGLTTVIDLVVVFFFTHPVMRLLARTKFFGQGHKLSGFHYSSLGLDGPRYVGRGRVNPGTSKKTPAKPQFNADGSRMTIAQRKAAELELQQASGAQDSDSISKDGEN